MRASGRPGTVQLRVVCGACGRSERQVLTFAEAVSKLRDGLPFRCAACGAPDPALIAPDARQLPLFDPRNTV